MAIEVEKKSDEILQAITKGTPDLVYAKDLEGRYLLINDQAFLLKINVKTA